LEINDAERGKCRIDRQNPQFALFFSYYTWNASVSAHNIRGPA
jgi:hypothetical protein